MGQALSRESLYCRPGKSVPWQSRNIYWSDTCRWCNRRHQRHLTRPTSCLSDALELAHCQGSCGSAEHPFNEWSLHQLVPLGPFRKLFTSCINCWCSEMVKAFGMERLGVAPSLTSRQIIGSAIDMSVSWQGNLLIVDSHGNTVEIKTPPWSGMNLQLHRVGESYGVIKYNRRGRDEPHWSDNGT